MTCIKDRLVFCLLSHNLGGAMEKVRVQPLKRVKARDVGAAHDPQHRVVGEVATLRNDAGLAGRQFGLDGFELSVDVHSTDSTRHPRLPVKTPKSQPFSDNDWMGALRKTVAENLQRLMDEHVELRSQSALARRSKVPQRTIGRIVNQEVTASLDVLEALSKPFDLQPWQLLVPSIDPKNPPVLRFASAAEEALYKRIVAAATELARKQP